MNKVIDWQLKTKMPLILKVASERQNLCCLAVSAETEMFSEPFPQTFTIIAEEMSSCVTACFALKCQIKVYYFYPAKMRVVFLVLAKGLLDME